MNSVDLGFLEPCDSWRLENRFFPSKAGGKPAWLELEGIPGKSELTCSKCLNTMIFLCQIYAPIEEDESNFHRTLFVFVCRNVKCCERNKADNIRIFRSNLKRLNKYYSPDPPIEEQNANSSSNDNLCLCETCGCSAEKKCGKCGLIAYCSRDHQVVDWKEKHKTTCISRERKVQYSKLLYPEFEIVIEPESLNVKQVDEEKEREIAESLGTMSFADETELDKYSAVEKDKIFSKFRKQIEEYPDQVLRYSKGGQLLYISEDSKEPDDILKCEYCDSPRQFEFQIMPQMLSLLGEHEIDWGVLIFYTCKMSCTVEGIKYKRELVFKQDVSDS